MNFRISGCSPADTEQSFIQMDGHLFKCGNESKGRSTTESAYVLHTTIEVMRAIVKLREHIFPHFSLVRFFCCCRFSYFRFFRCRLSTEREMMRLKNVRSTSDCSCRVHLCLVRGCERAHFAMKIVLISLAGCRRRHRSHRASLIHVHQICRE